MAVATRTDASSNHSSILIGLGGLLLLLLTRYLYLQVQGGRKVRALGTHAPTLKSWMPMGLGIIADVLIDQKKHALLERWLSFFAGISATHPYTREAKILGTRIIFTADEENIKALLATQFADFGKGKQFNKEWHDFLGDSTEYFVFLVQWVES